jgi:protein TonB
MAVQILNDMPDAEVHHGDQVGDFLREIDAPRVRRAHLSGRTGFIVITIALHFAAGLALWQMKYHDSLPIEAVPIEAALLDTPTSTEAAPPQYSPPPVNLVYSVPTPDEVTFETDAITAEPMASPAETSSDGGGSAAPPMVASVEYIRAAPPIYPKESQRRHEYGTVLLRVLVDALGRPAQVQVERSSGFDRLDSAARSAVEKFLFRPYEVNGVARPAQVLIPIGFDHRSS